MYTKIDQEAILRCRKGNKYVEYLCYCNEKLNSYFGLK